MITDPQRFALFEEASELAAYAERFTWTVAHNSSAEALRTAFAKVERAVADIRDIIIDTLTED